MSQNNPVPPVEHRVRVALAPAAAFDLFTRQIGRWWPFAGHSCFGKEARDVSFDGREGGEVLEHARNGQTVVWGRLTTWQPPHGFSMSWHPGLSASEATLLAVRFVAVDGGTEVSVHHSRWEARGAQARAKRDQYEGGWPLTLAAYAACALKGFAA